MWGCGEIVTSYIAGGNAYIIATLGSSLAIPQKVKVGLAILLLGALKITCSCKNYIWMFIAVLFIIAKSWRQWKCPLLDKLDYPYSEILLFNNKMQWTNDICYSIGEN